MTDSDRVAARLAEIRARHDAATPGPWWHDESENCWRLHGVAFRSSPPPDLSWLPVQVANKQILKAPKQGTPYAEYWPDDGDAPFIVHAWEDMRRLLRLADAMLARHQPKTISYTTPCATHWRLPHLLADRAEADACPDCLTVDRQVCRSCRHECPDDDTWPCEEYRDITSALLGKEATDG